MVFTWGPFRIVWFVSFLIYFVYPDEKKNEISLCFSIAFYSFESDTGSVCIICYFRNLLVAHGSWRNDIFVKTFSQISISIFVNNNNNDTEFQQIFSSKLD